MSIVYEKSISSKYKKYFEQISDVSKPFAEYSLKTQKFLVRDESRDKKWELGNAGVPLVWIQSEDKLFVDQTDSHTLVIGPTGSKKSRLIAMPLVRILGSASETIIISDPKAEIYDRTASYLKKQGYQIAILNLRSPLHGNRWNPLYIPYDFYVKGEIDKAYEFVNDIAENLMQSDEIQNDPFWSNSAGSLFFGLVLLLFKYCKENNKGSEYVHIGNVMQIRNILISKSKTLISKEIWNYAKTDPIIAAALIGTVETANDTQKGILSVFDQKMRMFMIQPNLLDMLSNNDILFDNIGSVPIAVFLIVPDEKTGYHGLVSLFIKQSYEYIIHKAQLETGFDGVGTGKLSNRVNYVLDEFSSLPTIKDFPAMMTASRSRNIRFTLMIQSKHQLLQRYKEETETIITNCNNWIFFTSRELQLLEEISALCGKTTGDVSNPLLPITMLQRLSKEEGEGLLLCGRNKPCITKFPDIDIYDNCKYEKVMIVPHETKTLPIIEFDDFFFLQHINEDNMEDLLKDYNNVDIDDLVAKIDKKIAELEEQEELESDGSIIGKGEEGIINERN